MWKNLASYACENKNTHRVAILWCAREGRTRWYMMNIWHMCKFIFPKLNFSISRGFSRPTNKTKFYRSYKANGWMGGWCVEYSTTLGSASCILLLLGGGGVQRGVVSSSYCGWRCSCVDDGLISCLPTTKKPRTYSYLSDCPFRNTKRSSIYETTKISFRCRETERKKIFNCSWRGFSCQKCRKQIWHFFQLIFNKLV